MHVEWERVGYTNEDLNSIRGDGLTVREHMDQLTSKFVRATSEEEINNIINNGELSPEFLSDLKSCGPDIEKRILSGMAKVPEPSTQTALTVAKVIKKDLETESPKPQTPPRPFVGGGGNRQRPSTEPLIREMIESRSLHPIKLPNPYKLPGPPKRPG